MKRDNGKGGSWERGFTLVELIVAVGLFAVVMLISTVALLSLVSANRKAQALQSVMNNLNVAVDGMVRSIRMGSDYDCDSDAPTDCPDGGTRLTFQPFCDQDCATIDRMTYQFGGIGCAQGRLCKSEGGGELKPITAQNITIENLKFYVIGTARAGGDIVQPKVVISIQGTAGIQGTKTETNFALQATAVQRILDL